MAGGSWTDGRADTVTRLPRAPGHGARDGRGQLIKSPPARRRCFYLKEEGPRFVGWGKEEWKLQGAHNLPAPASLLRILAQRPKTEKGTFSIRV